MDRLTQIYSRQATYVGNLAATYRHNGFTQYLQLIPWDLDSRKAQEEFRALAWRIVEEVIEAEEYRATRRHPEYLEEVADALHFFIEFCLITGISEDELVTGMTSGINLYDDKLDYLFGEAKRSLNPSWNEFIRALGLVMMEFRQRPWRTDSRPTNRERFVMAMHLAFQEFINACHKTTITADELYRAYFEKAAVNLERIGEYGV